MPRRSKRRLIGDLSGAWIEGVQLGRNRQGLPDDRCAYWRERNLEDTFVAGHKFGLQSRARLEQLDLPLA